MTSSFVNHDRTTLMGIANYMTVARILLVPMFVLTFYLPLQGMPLLAIIVFTVAAITDWLDGYFARYFKQVSPLGIFLDPVADKLMVVSAFVLLNAKTDLQGLTLPTLVIVCREIFISALREWMAKAGQPESIKVSYLGKLKTTTQMIAVILLLTCHYHSHLPLVLKTGYVLTYVATLLTLWSMGDYIKSAWKAIYSI